MGTLRRNRCERPRDLDSEEARGTRKIPGDGESALRAATSEFHALQVTQRPAFVIDTEIGDRAVFSGIVRPEPFVATLDGMLEDAAAYAVHRAHFGAPPA